MIQIYYIEGSEQRGPVSIEEFGRLGLSPDTPVWYHGLSQWTPAHKASLTSHLFRTPPPPPYSRPQGAYSGYGNPDMPRPQTYLAWAILATLLCCLPLGIPAIIYAAQVDSLWAQRRYDEAYRASRNAKNWTIASVVVSVAGILFYWILAFAGVISLAALGL